RHARSAGLHDPARRRAGRLCARSPAERSRPQGSAIAARRQRARNWPVFAGTYGMNDIVAWCVFDPATNELVLICKSRAEARKIAAECDGAVAVVRRVR